MAGPARWKRPGQGGQATVELALVLPVVLILLLVLVQVALVVRAQLLVIEAAREAARVAAVDNRPGRAEAAARRVALDPTRLRVRIGRRGRPGELVEADVEYTVRTDLPLVGPLVGDVHVEAHATMRVEQ